MNKIVVEAPAKINLTLDIKGKRSDGYHELETVMHQVSLSDKITLEKAKGISLTSNSNLIPTDATNLAWKAAKLILAKFNDKAGVKIYIEKNIPVGAGLAGGSTDAAAVLLGLNRLYNFNLGTGILGDLALELGSDVPFCLFPASTAIARGRGELLTPLSNLKKLHFLLVKPDFQVSTREIFAGFSLEQVVKTPDLDAFIKAWQEYEVCSLNKYMVNVLETVSIKKYPEIRQIKQKLKNRGALSAVMSGSGPTVWGWFNDLDILEDAYNYFSANYQEVFKVSSYVRGE